MRGRGNVLAGVAIIRGFRQTYTRRKRVRWRENTGVCVQGLARAECRPPRLLYLSPCCDMQLSAKCTRHALVYLSIDGRVILLLLTIAVAVLLLLPLPLDSMCSKLFVLSLHTATIVSRLLAPPLPPSAPEFTSIIYDTRRFAETVIQNILNRGMATEDVSS